MKKTLQSHGKEAFGRWFLDDILDWINDNLEPDQVWTEDELLDFIVLGPSGIYKELLAYIAEKEEPEGVFDRDRLAEWAEKNSED